MKLLYAPWRDDYTVPEDNNTAGQMCVFCSQFKLTTPQDDKNNFIIKRFESCAVMLNLYPYNAGHLLIVPYAHKENLHDLSQSERAELIEVTSLSIQILDSTLNSQATNMGMNIGKAAGGSIPQHLHIHAVPRWTGDTNFLAAIANTKPISRDMHKIYEKLRAAFN